MRPRSLYRNIYMHFLGVLCAVGGLSYLMFGHEERDLYPLPRPLMLVGLLALVGVAVRPLARRISRPIESIIAASRRFGQGELSTRVQLPRVHPRHHRRRHHGWPEAWILRRHYGDEMISLVHAW